MFWLLNTHGIIGVAIAWLLRAALDGILLTIIARWQAKDIKVASGQIYPMLVAPLPLFAIGLMLHDFTTKMFFTGLAFLALIIGGYFFAVTPEEKNAIQRLAQRFLRT